MKWVKLGMKVLLGLLFVAAGVNHFVNPAFYVRIMPPYFPWPLETVYVSGVGEVVFGLLLLVPATSVAAAWGIILMLILFLPVHLHMAMHPAQYPQVASWLLFLRLPLQAVLIWWAWWFTRGKVLPAASGH